MSKTMTSAEPLPHLPAWLHVSLERLELFVKEVARPVLCWIEGDGDADLARGDHVHAQLQQQVAGMEQDEMRCGRGKAGRCESAPDTSRIKQEEMRKSCDTVMMGSLCSVLPSWELSLWRRTSRNGQKGVTSSGMGRQRYGTTAQASEGRHTHLVLLEYVEDFCHEAKLAKHVVGFDVNDRHVLFQDQACQQRVVHAAVLMKGMTFKRNERRALVSDTERDL